MSRGPVAVVRFSSLGDVLLAAHVPSFLKRAMPDTPTLFVTKGRYATALAGHPDLDGLFLLDDGSSADDAVRADDARTGPPILARGALPDLAAGLRATGVDTVIDLHGNLRSAALRRAVGPAQVVRAPKHGLRRRLMVHAKWIHTRPVPPLLRSYRSLAGLPPDASVRPWLRDALTAGDRARAADARSGLTPGGFAVYGVGARWATKRWPLRHFVALARAVEREAGLAPRFALTPEEPGTEAALDALLGAGFAHEAVTLDLRALAALATDAAVLVSNDSAVLHLGPALGVPAFGLFGSTVPAFGFARQGPRDAVGEIALPCRPCGVHGRDHCPLGHHACMESLTPEIALDALRPLLATVAAA